MSRNPGLCVSSKFHCIDYFLQESGELNPILQLQQTSLQKPQKVVYTGRLYPTFPLVISVKELEVLRVGSFVLGST